MANMAQTDKGYTTGQASAVLGVTSQTIINWMEGEKLAFYRVMDGPRKCKPSVLLKFVNDNLQPGIIKPEAMAELERRARNEMQEGSEADFSM